MIKRYDKNKYKILDETTEIYIHNYKTQELIGTIIIDTEDFEKIKDYKWVFNQNGYARNSKLGLMHRYIMNCVDNKIVDHVNQNKLDNRKSNLRIANKSLNARNSNKRKGYRVLKSKTKGDRYKAFIKVEGKQLYLGTYNTKEEATNAYKRKRYELYGC